MDGSKLGTQLGMGNGYVSPHHHDPACRSRLTPKWYLLWVQEYVYYWFFEVLVSKNCGVCEGKLSCNTKPDRANPFDEDY